MAFAAFPSLVIDCPDPERLAAFYGAMLGWQVKATAEWGEIRSEDGAQYICFQAVADFAAPVWPGQEHPQQMHLDVMVRDLDEGEAAALELGGIKADHQPGTSFRVFLDPAGHPFCLCVD